MKLLLSFSLILLTVSVQSQEIGLQLYSVRNEVKKDLKETLQKVRSMGIKELEGGETYGMSIKAYTKMIHAMGFKMVGIGVDYDALTKDLTPTIEQAKKMGASYVTCFWIGHKGDEFGVTDI